MVVAANDFFFCGCASHAEDDTSPQGGAIDKHVWVVMGGLEMTNPDLLQMESNLAIDGSYEVTGRNNAGALVTDTFIFSNETGPVDGEDATTFARILKVRKLTGYSPTTIDVSAVIGVHEKFSGFNKCYLYGSGRSPTGEEIIEVRRLFLNATRPLVTSPPTVKYLYEKFFILNVHATDALSSGYVCKTLDPAGLVTFDIEDTIDGTEATANRLTSPAAVLGSFDSLDKLIVDGLSPSTGRLQAGEAVGVWVRLRLTAGLVAGVGSVNFMIDGEGL